jgi:hypothetical protein
MTFHPEQERDRVQGARITRFLAGGVIIGALSVGASTWLLHCRAPALTNARALPTAPATVAPRTIGSIEQRPLGGTAVGWELRDRQRRELQGYRWVDRDAGIAEIPIDQAMSLVAEDAGP